MLRESEKCLALPFINFLLKSCFDYTNKNSNKNLFGSGQDGGVGKRGAYIKIATELQKNHS